MGLSVVCLAMSVVALWRGPVEDATGLDWLFGQFLGMCGGIAGLLFAGSVLVAGFNRWRGKVPMLGPRSSPPRAWEEYEIMDGLRARSAFPLIGSSTIGRRALAVTMVMTLAALVIWTYYNAVN